MPSTIMDSRKCFSLGSAEIDSKTENYELFADSLGSVLGDTPESKGGWQEWAGKGPGPEYGCN